ncbi:MAG: replication initiator protein A [Pirellulaceae bacterium]
MNEIARDRSPLLPDRYQTADFFVCDIFDAAPKGDMASMEHPIFSLSTKPDTRIRRYQNGENFVEIQPSAKGLATVHDRDVLIYCISQLMVAVNEGKAITQILRFKAYDLLVATNRATSGDAYSRLRDTFDRLAGTRISTNIVTGGEEVYDNFGLVERVTIVRETRDGRMQEVEVKLSDWVFNAIRHNEVLTLSRDYFRLRKPLERRLYEIARKHVGRQAEWRISLEKLQNKCGSSSTLKEFRRLVGAIIEEDESHSHLPDYSIAFDGDNENMVVFRSRAVIPAIPSSDSPSVPPLSADAYHDARLAAPGWDVYLLEQEWRAWMTEPPRNPEAAFVGFCRKWFERRGMPH